VSKYAHSLGQASAKIVDEFHLILIPIIFVAIRNEAFITFRDVAEGSD
jgi:hypothetical protein